MQCEEHEPLRISSRLKDALIADQVRDDTYDPDYVLRTGAGNDPVDWTEHLARQLGLSTRYHEHGVAGLHDTLLVVLPELEDRLRRWPLVVEARDLQPVAESATSGLTPVEVYATMLAGSKVWRSQVIGADVRIDKLASQLRIILNRTLASSLAALLCRWAEWDIRTIREQRAAAKLRQDTARAEAAAADRALRGVLASTKPEPRRRIPPPPPMFEPPGRDWAPTPKSPPPTQAD